jgi:hypothetical protein
MVYPNTRLRLPETAEYWKGHGRSGRIGACMGHNWPLGFRWFFVTETDGNEVGIAGRWRKAT